MEEVFHFLFVARERGRADLDLVAVLVVALRGDLVDGFEVVGEFVVDYSKGGEVVWVEVAAAVVGFALVALSIGVSMRMMGG